MRTTKAVVRAATPADLEGVVAVDASRSGKAKAAYWKEVLATYADPARRRRRVALVAEGEPGEVAGFLFGEVRAWEFGSEPCGWIFSVAVRPDREREGTGTQLCREAVRCFREMGVDVVRTMIRRTDVPIQALFRSMGFAAGPFSELELDLKSTEAEGVPDTAEGGGAT